MPVFPMNINSRGTQGTVLCVLGALPITVAAASLCCSSMFTVIDLLFVIKHKEDISRTAAR